MSDASARGWGRGWPTNRQADMTWVRAPISGARWEVHRRVAPLLAYIVGEAERRGYLFDHGPGDVDDDWGYSNRPIRGTRTPSNHSWGLAALIALVGTVTATRGSTRGHQADIAAQLAEVVMREQREWSDDLRESEQACRDQLDQMRGELERMRIDLASTRRELEDTRRELEQTRGEVHGLRQQMGVRK